MMEKFKEYIIQNLPDRFKGLRVFRIPVRCDGVSYWAIYNNGEWKFEPGSAGVEPIINYVSELKEDTLTIQEEEFPLNVPTMQPEQVKGKKEKPVREKKEKPVKEKPVREKKEKPVKEKKERPAREKKETPAPVVNDGFEDMDAEFISGQCTFNQSCLNKKMSSLTGRIILAVITILMGNLICGIGSIITASKANKSIGNPIDYWHYRKVNAIWHFSNVCYFLVIVIMIIAAVSGMLTISALIGGSVF